MPSIVSEDDYVLKRDYDASTRLTAQHYLWKSALGYLLHPSIPVPSQPRIADVATGNGIWLCDLASTLPEPNTLNGFDISLDQAPAPGAIPNSNIRFNTWDILRDPPAEFIGAFDIVHIRLITVVFRENNPVPIIESLKKLLKPGGFLQWEEVDNVNCNVLKPADDEAPALEKILSQLSGSGKGDWKQHAASVLNENGFSNAQQFHVEHGKLEARFWNDMYVSTWAEFAKQTMGNLETAKALATEAMKEVRRGAAINCPMWIWVAQND